MRVFFNTKMFHSFKTTPVNLFVVSCLTLFVNLIMAGDIPEAQQIALESSGELLAPDALVKRVEKDLNAIRAKYPAVADVHHTQKWQPGKVMVQDVAKEKLEEWSKTTTLGPCDVKAIFQQIIFLVTFNKPYNPEKLAEVMKNELGTDNVRPDGVIGGSSSITLTSEPSGKNKYVVMKGWGDCMSGCINKHFWTFTTGPGDEVELVEESGDDPSGADGADRPVGMGLF